MFLSCCVQTRETLIGRLGCPMPELPTTPSIDAPGSATELRGVPRRHQGSHPARSGAGCEGDQRGAHRGLLADRQGDRAPPGRGWPGAGPADTGGGTAAVGRSAGGFPRRYRVLAREPRAHAVFRRGLARRGGSRTRCARPSVGAHRRAGAEARRPSHQGLVRSACRRLDPSAATGLHRHTPARARRRGDHELRAGLGGR